MSIPVTCKHTSCKENTTLTVGFTTNKKLDLILQLTFTRPDFKPLVVTYSEPYSLSFLLASMDLAISINDFRTWNFGNTHLSHLIPSLCEKFAKHIAEHVSIAISKTQDPLCWVTIELTVDLGAAAFYRSSEPIPHFALNNFLT